MHRSYARLNGFGVFDFDCDNTSYEGLFDFNFGNGFYFDFDEGGDGIGEGDYNFAVTNFYFFDKEPG
jgi:type II restriction/modification system DNA methylase subunit YeeA